MTNQNSTNKTLVQGTKVGLSGAASQSVLFRNASGLLAALTPVNSGFVQWDASGNLVAAAIPLLRTHEFVQVPNTAGRLALATTQVQPGDEAYEIDTKRTYKLVAADPSLAPSWVLIGDIDIDASNITSGVIDAARLPTVGMTWTTVTAATQQAAVGNGYFANSATQIVFTLPATATAGQALEIVGLGAGGWRLGQAATQSIVMGDLTSLAGTPGWIESTHARDAVTLRAVSATQWQVVASQGNIEVKDA
jgi:hypothetical protein